MTLTLRPDLGDLATIAQLVARVVAVVSLAMLLPALFGLVNGERDAAAVMMFGAALGLLLSGIAELLFVPSPTIS